MAALRKTTQIYAHHGIPLHCDIYDAVDFPMNAPIFLFFHSGGLVGGGRILVPPWLVQTCYRQMWPLISVSYRLTPQARGKLLLEDVKAAYEFAKQFCNRPTDRSVIVGGASAGAFMATLAAHYVQPTPLALLSISGIPTFRHPFFNSSIQLTPEPVPKADVEHFLKSPLVVGSASECDKWAFVPDMLLPGTAVENPAYVRPNISGKNSALEESDRLRRMLYEYFIYENSYGDMLGTVDAGFEWAKEKDMKWERWPKTILIQGDQDIDVDPDLCISVADMLEDRARLFMAKDQPHMFEATKFIEDDSMAMDVVRVAVDYLKSAVIQALAGKDSYQVVESTTVHD